MTRIDFPFGDVFHEMDQGASAQRHAHGQRVWSLAQVLQL